MALIKVLSPWIAWYLPATPEWVWCQIWWTYWPGSNTKLRENSQEIFWHSQNHLLWPSQHTQRPKNPATYPKQTVGPFWTGSNSIQTSTKSMFDLTLWKYCTVVWQNSIFELGQPFHCSCDAITECNLLFFMIFSV